jgi:Collagen triple helix repeat (20 copies)
MTPDRGAAHLVPDPADHEEWEGSMNMAHAEETPATLVGLDDTQQIHRIGADTPDTARGRKGEYRTILWALLAVAALAAGALGVAFFALTSTPDAVAGPAGPAGLQGATGAQGAQGVPGPQGLTGPQGPAGPRGAPGVTGKQGAAGPAGAAGARGPVGATGASGTIASSTAVSGAAVLSGVDAPVGTAVTATATCPAGEVALGGGAQVTAPGTSAKDVALRSSFPTSANGWRATGSVIAPLGPTDQMSVHPYVLCGKPSHT